MKGCLGRCNRSNRIGWMAVCRCAVCVSGFDQQVNQRESKKQRQPPNQSGLSLFLLLCSPSRPIVNKSSFLGCGHDSSKLPRGRRRTQAQSPSDTADAQPRRLSPRMGPALLLRSTAVPRQSQRKTLNSEHPRSPLPYTHYVCTDQKHTHRNPISTAPTLG